MLAKITNAANSRLRAIHTVMTQHNQQTLNLLIGLRAFATGSGEVISQ